MLCQRIEAGAPIAHVAAAMGISRRCASKWWHRYLEFGPSGLVDRSRRPPSSPTRTSEALEARICRLRRTDKRGADHIAYRLEMSASTVQAVLRRHDLGRLDHLDRQSGREIRRYERERPGELVHVDVKKLGRIPDGGGHRVLGRNTTTGAQRHKRKKLGFAYIHSAVDDHSRLAYSEVLADETGATSAAFGAGPRPGSGPTGWSSSGS